MFKKPARGAAVSRGRRHESRLRVRLSARLTTLNGTRAAILEDLSIAGARVASTSDLKPGMQAILHWGKFEAFGVIRWHDTLACGVEFFDPLNRAQIIMTRDLDDRHRLPEDNQLARNAASAFVNGKTRL